MPRSPRRGGADKKITRHGLRTKAIYIGGAFAILVVIAIVVAAISGGNGGGSLAQAPNTTTSSQELVTWRTATNYRQLLRPGWTAVRAAKTTCAPLRKRMNRWTRLQASLQASLQGADTDPYAAMHFAAKHSWVTTSQATDFSFALDDVFTRRLNATTREANNRPPFADAFRRDVLFVCHSGASVRRTHAALVRLDNRARHVVALAARGRALVRAKAAAAARAAREARIAAANAWHQGYFQQDDNVYWKALSGQSCADYAVNGCWHIEVITRDGCPSYLGVQANEYQGSAIVGDLLGNNATGIPPKTVAIIELDADANGVTLNNVTVQCE